MKLTEDKIEKICGLRYKGVKVSAIALTEKVSEKSVRNILKKYYTPMYLKIRAMTQPGNESWGSSRLNGKSVTGMERRYDEGSVNQDANWWEHEHQRLIETIKEQEKTIDTYKENDQTKDLQLEQKNEELDKDRKEIESLKQKNKDYESVIQKNEQEILYLKQVNLSGIQVIRKDISEVKITFNKGITAIQENIGTLTSAHNQLNLSFKTHDTITQEKNKLEQELQTLKAKHNNDLIKYSAVGVLGFSAGMLVDRFVLPPILNSILPYSVESGKNTGYDAIPNPQKGVIRPSIYGMGSGVGIAGMRLMGFGKGCWIGYPAALQKYIRQT